MSLNFGGINIGGNNGGGGGTSNHSQLTNLDYASAGHTGFMSSDNYLPSGTTITVASSGADYTSLNDAIAALAGKWSNGVVNISIAAGTYSSSSAININGKDFNIPYLDIYGAGINDTVINFSNSYTTGVIQTANINNTLRLRNMTINCASRDSAGSRGVNIINTEGIVFALNLKVTNSESGINVATLGRAQISGSTIQNCNIGIWTGNASYTFCMNNTFDTCEYGIMLYKGAQVSLEGTGTFTDVTNNYNQAINTLTSNGIIFGSW